VRKITKKGVSIATGMQAGSAGLGGTPQGGGKKGGTPAEPAPPSEGPVSYY